MAEDLILDRVVVPLSSVVASFGYDETTRTLAVEELKTGDVWLYSPVPPQKAVAFESAPSLGVFYHRSIAHNDLYTKRKAGVFGACPQCGDVGLEGCTCDDCGCGNYARPDDPSRAAHLRRLWSPTVAADGAEQTVA